MLQIRSAAVEAAFRVVQISIFGEISVKIIAPRTAERMEIHVIKAMPRHHVRMAHARILAIPTTAMWGVLV